MNIEWDDNKAAANVEKHGLSFNDALNIFDDPGAKVVEDIRTDYGEQRLVVTGLIHQRLCVVVYTVRGDMIRFISARKANKREQRDHGYST